MTDKDDDESSDEDEEELTDDERRKRRRMRELKEKAEKILGKGSRKVDKGFEDAFGGHENAGKYLRRHQFKYGAEPKDKVPETKSSSVGGELWTEPSRWVPPKPAEDYPRKDAAEDLHILEKQNIEHDRREQQSNSEDQDDLRKAGALVQDDLETKDSNSTEHIATVEIETPLNTVHDITSRITSRFEDTGYRHVSTEVEPDAEEMARIETQARQDYAPTAEQVLEFIETVRDPLKVDQLLTPEDSISPLELSEQHERIRRKAIGEILEETQQELLQDFELCPEHVDVEEDV